MCWGRGLPSSAKLGRSLHYNVDSTCSFYARGRTPGTPLSLRGLSEGSCRRGCRSKLEVPCITHSYHISWLRICFDSPSGRNPRRAPEGKRVQLSISQDYAQSANINGLKEAEGSLDGRIFIDIRISFEIPLSNLKHPPRGLILFVIYV